MYKFINTMILISLLAQSMAILAGEITKITPGDKQFHHPDALVKSLASQSNVGQKIYKEFCANCHAVKPLISIGAPRIGISSDWKPRMKQTLDQMLAKIDPGFNAMPPRGGCFECSDQQLREAVVYMLPKKTTDSD